MEGLATHVAVDEGVGVGTDGTAEVTGAREWNDFRRRDTPTAFPQIAAEMEQNQDLHLKKIFKKSEKYWGQRRNGWAGAVMVGSNGGQGW